MDFSKLIGNDHIKSFLIKNIEKKTIANTLLFSGPDGIGKSLFAKELASFLMYPNAREENLKRLNEENHPDLHVYRPEGKTAMHSIASIRDLIDNVFMQPFEAKAKVFIIHDAERMLQTSSNALLKTLEEPTLDSYIILLSSEIDNLLPTILSRCMKIIFYHLTHEEMTKYLQTKLDKNKNEAYQIALLAHGSIAQAYYIATHEHFHQRKEKLVKILSQEMSEAPYALLQAIDEMEKNFFSDKADQLMWHKDIDILLTQIMMWYRDLHAIKHHVDEKHLYFGDFLSQLKKQNLFQLKPIEKVQQLVEKTRLGLSRNIKLKTCLENLFLQLMHFS